MARSGLERIVCGAQQIGSVSIWRGAPTWREMLVPVATGAETGAGESEGEFKGIRYDSAVATLSGIGAGEAMSRDRSAK